MKTKRRFAFRIDIWDDSGGSVVEHVAGADDFHVAEAIYQARDLALADGADYAAAGHPRGACHWATASPLKVPSGRLLRGRRCPLEGRRCVFRGLGYLPAPNASGGPY
jgi:hypothetical protein